MDFIINLSFVLRLLCFFYVHGLLICRKEDHMKLFVNLLLQQQPVPVGSRLHGVWGDMNVGSLILASITIRKEADSKRPTNFFSENHFVTVKIFFLQKIIKK